MRLRARDRSRLSRGPAPAAGGAWSPADLPGAEFWLRADLGITEGAGAGEVDAWASQIGSYTAVFANPALKPQLVASGLGGQPHVSIAYWGYMNTDYAPPSGAAPRGFFAVTSAIVTGGVGQSLEHLFHYGTAASRRAYGLTSVVSFAPDVGNHYWSDVLSSGDPPPAGGAVLTAAYSGTEDRILINGVEAGRRTVALNTGTAFTLIFGSRIAPADEVARYSLSEFVAMATDPSDDDVAAFMAYATARYGI